MSGQLLDGRRSASRRPRSPRAAAPRVSRRASPARPRSSASRTRSPIPDGAFGTVAGLGLVALAPSLARGRRRALWVATVLAACARSARPRRSGTRASALVLLVSRCCSRCRHAPSRRSGDPTHEPALRRRRGRRPRRALRRPRTRARRDRAPAARRRRSSRRLPARAQRGPVARSPRPRPRDARDGASHPRSVTAPTRSRRSRCGPTSASSSRTTATRFLSYTTVAGVALVSGDRRSARGRATRR